MNKLIQWGMPALVSACFFMGGCRKSDELGSTLLPANPLGLGQTDTLTLRGRTVPEERLATSTAITELIGRRQEPVFGTFTAETALQFSLPSNSVNFGAGATADSLVFILALNEVSAGDTTAPLNLNVSLLGEALSPDSIYYSDRKPALGAPVASYTVNHPNITTVVNEPRATGTDTLQPEGRQLRLRMPDALAQQFLAASGTASLASQANFLAFFPGLVVSPVGSGNAFVVQANLGSTLSGLVLYYHLDGARKRFKFDFASAAAHYTHFAHDFATTPVAAAQAQGTAAQQLFATGGQGVKAAITLPYLDKMAANVPGRMAVNKATLIFYVDESLPGFAATDAPPSLQLLAQDSLGANAYLPDQLDKYYGGRYNSATKSYAFDVSRYVQNVINGKPNYGLYLLTASPAALPSRVVLANASAANPLLRPRLTVTFTKIQ